jgi:hypothetical protein
MALDSQTAKKRQGELGDMKTIVKLLALAMLLGTLSFAQAGDKKADDSKKADTTTATTTAKTKKAKTKKASKKKAAKASAGDKDKK